MSSMRLDVVHQEWDRIYCGFVVESRGGNLYAGLKCCQ